MNDDQKKQESVLPKQLLNDRSLRPLMESFFEKMPKDQQVASVRLGFQELWNRAAQYLSKEDLCKIGEAAVFACCAHGKQIRHSGEPYVIHTLCAAAILAEMRLDRDTLIAALLHDVLEDTSVNAEELTKHFGSVVVTLVDGVTKLGKLPFKSIEDYQAENLRKMFLVMAKDIRVVLIKLADRLHNMRTLDSLKPEKQLLIAKETLEIYAPLAHRLGIYQVKRELEDLAFKTMDPEMFYDIRRRVRKKLPEREGVIKTALDILQKELQKEGIEAQISGRSKHFYSIYEKMQRKHLSLDQLYDLLALRVVVGTLAECYQVLGYVHTIWKPIPGQFDDYIANPKNNMYQSLHTTVVGPNGEPLEVQIRTREMHMLAEYGIAAHWQYKEQKSDADELDRKLSWIRQALEGQEENSQEPTASEFMDNLKTDVLIADIFVFTPKGKVISVPNGSTPIDFAYSIHTEVGHRCVGSMVNGRIVPMDYELKNGDIVRILTSPQGKPSRDWLKIAKANRTRTKIRSYFRAQDRLEREEKLRRGKELLERELQRRNPGQSVSLESISSQLGHVTSDLGYSGTEELILSVGMGNQTASGILSRLFEHKHPKTVEEPLPVTPPKKVTDSTIVVEGADGVLVTLAQCCYPIPGDSILGCVTQSRGITVHRKECINLKKTDPERKITVNWGTCKKRHIARLRIEGSDKGALFAEIAHGIVVMDGHLLNIRGNVVNNTRAHFVVEIEVWDVEHLYRIIAKINAVDGVVEIMRG